MCRSDFALSGLDRCGCLPRACALGYCIAPLRGLLLRTGNNNASCFGHKFYRGVIRERDLVAHDPATGTVTFRYIDASTKRPAWRELPIADFLSQVLQHVLPTGLRRVRDYGFLHGKAKARLRLVQLILRVLLHQCEQKPRPPMCCPRCKTPMRLIGQILRRPDG